MKTKSLYIVFILSVLSLIGSQSYGTGGYCPSCSGTRPECHHCDCGEWVPDTCSGGCPPCQNCVCGSCDPDPVKPQVCDNTCCRPEAEERCCIGHWDESEGTCTGDPTWGFCCSVDEICCDDGSCAMECQTMNDASRCSTSNNEDCIGCTLGTDNCSDYYFTTKIYTGSSTSSCSPTGCPGDCVQGDAIHCYSEYACMEGTTLTLYACGVEGEGVSCQPVPPEVLWFCSPCIKNPMAGVIEYVYPMSCM